MVATEYHGKQSMSKSSLGGTFESQCRADNVVPVFFARFVSLDDVGVTGSVAFGVADSDHLNCHILLLLHILHPFLSEEPPRGKFWSLETLTPGKRITDDVHLLVRSRGTSESRHQSRCAAAEMCTNWGYPAARGNQSWE